MAGSDGEKAGETREIVEVEDAPTDEDEEKAVEMEQWRGDVSDDTQQGIFLQQDDETEIEAPKHKVPARTVPKAGQKPDTEDVEGLMPPVSAHGDVDIVTE